MLAAFVYKKRTRTNLEKTHIYFLVVRILMYKQVSFVITAAIMLTALVTIALYTGSQTAHAAAIIVIKKHPILEKLQLAGGMKNATAAGGNMTKNATAAGGNMTK
jgi:hypothetical protein